MDLYKQVVTPQVVKSFGLPSELELWRERYSSSNNVEVSGQWVWTNGVEWHKDPAFPRYTGLLIVVNSGMQIHTKMKSVVPSPGDLVILNTHYFHQAVPTGNDQTELIAIITSFHNKPSVEQVLEKIEKY